MMPSGVVAQVGISELCLFSDPAAMGARSTVRMTRGISRRSCQSAPDKSNRSLEAVRRRHPAGALHTDLRNRSGSRHRLHGQAKQRVLLKSFSGCCPCHPLPLSGIPAQNPRHEWDANNHATIWVWASTTRKVSCADPPPRQAHITVAVGDSGNL